MRQIHATAVSIDGHGVLIRGDSGSGKSDLALRLIDGGARLIADDRCDLSVVENRLQARCPGEISGLLEIRGLGIFRFEPLKEAVISLIVDLCDTSRIERLPKESTVTVLGVPVPGIRLAGFEASASAKVRLAARRVHKDMETIS